VLRVLFYFIIIFFFNFSLFSPLAYYILVVVCEDCIFHRRSYSLSGGRMLFSVKDRLGWSSYHLWLDHLASNQGGFLCRGVELLSMLYWNLFHRSCHIKLHIVPCRSLLFGWWVHAGIDVWSLWRASWRLPEWQAHAEAREIISKDLRFAKGRWNLLRIKWAAPFMLAFNHHRRSQATAFAVGITDSCLSCDAGTYAAIEGSVEDPLCQLHNLIIAWHWCSVWNNCVPYTASLLWATPCQRFTSLEDFPFRYIRQRRWLSGMNAATETRLSQTVGI
jgi:hypothetical protein